MRTVDMMKIHFHDDSCSLKTRKWMPLIRLVWYDLDDLAPDAG